ncbi:hypothetical protein [Maledivibacter halophilus]|uniref:Uncharacterized protein n=1 Tax=Maledivibacter halophilus TaxID=36842 RepID=A0A1T5LW25_9FIRM|nr:hypothetical protein [Maledivibacter halophilus]SKC80034.1 hypothetical protein SAMN02194393_03415 [Maledivibacter halophilus]
MEVALSVDLLKEIVRHKYDYDEKRIVGIMLARYDISLIKNIISDCYQYWHLNTGKVLDIYWAGYGAYLCPDEQTSTKTILEFPGNNNRVYFDLDAFITIKNELNQVSDKKYKDHIELILANYYDGYIHFNETFKIDLEKNFDENYVTIRQLVELLTNKCKSKHDVVSLIRELKKIEFFNIIKGFTTSDVINKALAIAGIVI